MKRNQLIKIFTSSTDEAEETFEGWAKLLKVVEEKSTFLLEDKLYRLVRVLVEFVKKVPKGELAGKFNDPFMVTPFVTHRNVRVLLKENPTDADISDFENYYSQNKKSKINEQTKFRQDKNSTAYLLGITAGGTSRTFELYYYRRFNRGRKNGSCSESRWKGVENSHFYYR